eukprot:COSAG05_NODE_9588_length_613_cov_1.597276_2_plen_116_part_01
MISNSAASLLFLLPLLGLSAQTVAGDGLNCSTQKQMIVDGFAFIRGICCVQSQSTTCHGKDGTPYPSNCSDPSCASAVKQVASACIPFLLRPENQWLGSQFLKPMQAAYRKCYATR